MSSRRYIRKQIEVLFWRQEGLCYYCDEPMLPPGSYKPKTGVRIPDDFCTLEHLDDKFSQERGRHAGKIRRVAACNFCNNKKGRESQAAQPIEELWRRSGRYPPGVLSWA